LIRLFIRALGGFALLGMAPGCFAGDGAHEVQTTPRHEAARAREAKRWEGKYAFDECGTPSGGASKRCFKYEVVVTKEGGAWVGVEGDPKPTRIKARPRVEKDQLRLAFEAYVEDEDVGDVGLRTLDPLRGRFMPGDGLATLTRDTSGRPCLRFEKLESRLGAKSLCATVAE
jgi:hypothetical protein